MELDYIEIRGAREHNLKSVDVRIPKKKLVVLTGVSGSGKSSLAFDTLYAEGQRRYVESLSAYARQFLGRMEKPRFDAIRGLSPTISIEQKTTGTNPRSTVGTITEISDYLRVLYARIGVQHCHQCGRKVAGQTPQQIAQDLAALPDGTRLILLASLLVNRKGEHRELLEKARQRGFVRLRVDGSIVESAELEALDKRKKHTVEAVIDRLVLRRDVLAQLTESVELALREGTGNLIAHTETAGDRPYSQSRACPHCNISFPELSPQAFSFNSPQGMCLDCNGLGTRMQIDPGRLIKDPELTIDEGAVDPWGTDVSKKIGWSHGFRGQILKQLGISTKVPWKKLPAAQKRLILEGAGERKFRVTWKGGSGRGTFDTQWDGLLTRLLKGFRQTGSEKKKEWLQKYLADRECSTCHGKRLKRESAAVTVAEKTLVDVAAMTVEAAAEFFGSIRLSKTDQEIATEVLKEVNNRLKFLVAVGLGYLSLDRAGPTLSGGESQRIRLASQVGSELTGVIYVLDEPSIGLHQRDNGKLLDTLTNMRDIGNTVVVVEHDEDTIRRADHVIDFGPGAGTLGGRVVHAGTPASLGKCQESLTGAYLSGRKRIEVPQERREAKGWLKVRGASENNLRNLDVAFPLQTLCVVTGVSGAGKSSLIGSILYPVLANRLNKAEEKIGAHLAVDGVEQLDKVVNIDQHPIGRTPRSNPATYVKVFDEIRKLFAEVPDAKVRGYSPGRFSFNVPGGRCEACEGDGVRKIEMHFLPDVFVKCEECQGRRFNDATLEVRYRGRSISDVLGLTIREARELFSAHRNISEPLTLLEAVGVDYLHLGQPSPTLSGGEAQRIKLSRELARKATGRTLYILDEPTTGLHFEDTAKLLQVLKELVDSGNTVIVIEHNLDVIKCADHVIDLGPEGGPGGGSLIACGTPEAVAKNPRSHTGRFLAPLLRRKSAPSLSEAVAARASSRGSSNRKLSTTDNAPRKRRVRATTSSRAPQR